MGKRIFQQKNGLKSTNADWRPVDNVLDSEIKVRYYSPMTLESYGESVRQLQISTAS